jgi:hypothetical protein
LNRSGALDSREVLRDWHSRQPKNSAPDGHKDDCDLLNFDLVELTRIERATS